MTSRLVSAAAALPPVLVPSWAAATVDVGQFAGLLGSLSPRAKAKQRAAVCFWVFDVEGNGAVNPAEVQTGFMRMAELCAPASDAGQTAEDIRGVQEAAMSIIGHGDEHGSLSEAAFIAAVRASELPLVRKVRSLFHWDSGVFLGLAP
jgi:hypothetical protein